MKFDGATATLERRDRCDHFDVFVEIATHML